MHFNADTVDIGSMFSQESKLTSAQDTEEMRAYDPEGWWKTSYTVQSGARKEDQSAVSLEHW